MHSLSGWHDGLKVESRLFCQNRENIDSSGMPFLPKKKLRNCLFSSGEFSRRSQGYYGEVGAAFHKIAQRFYNLNGVQGTAYEDHGQDSPRGDRKRLDGMPIFRAPG